MSEIRNTNDCERDERESAKKALKKKIALNQILGKSQVVKELQNKIELISSCDASVLITGESGTGKELAARAIHDLSYRSDRPFIPINCSAIPENLIENEFFGHVQGAFTDARYPQTGLVKEAEGGTLFLDEIGTISPYVQVKFLRLLQDGEYKPLGSSKIYKADIRIIAATNKTLIKSVKEGKFRDDLFYRLNIVSLHIPPLRERKEDIPALVNHFLNMYSRKYNKPTKEFSNNASAAFMSQEWPGNIRELENKVQQLVVTSTSSVINDKDILCPVSISADKHHDIKFFKIAKKKAVNTFEKNYLARLLIMHKGNVSRAARMSGQSRTALWNLLRKHKMSPETFRSSHHMTRHDDYYRTE